MILEYTGYMALFRSMLVLLIDELAAACSIDATLAVWSSDFKVVDCMQHAAAANATRAGAMAVNECFGGIPADAALACVQPLR